jgi:hypothetical protein
MVGQSRHVRGTVGLVKAFARFVRAEGALVSVLRVAAVRDEQMLAPVQKSPG